MDKKKRLFSYYMFVYMQNLYFKSIVFLGGFVIVSVHVLFHNSDNNLSLRFIPDELHELIIKGIYPGFIPLFAGLYLMQCIIYSEELYRSEQIKIILTKSYSRYEILSTHLISALLFSILYTGFFYLITFRFYDISFQYIVNILLILFTVYLQVLFLRSVKINKQVILLIYIALFIFLPMFLNEILIVIIYDNIDSIIINYIAEYLISFFSLNINLLTNLGLAMEFKTLFIIGFMYLTSLLMYSKKEFY